MPGKLPHPSLQPARGFRFRSRPLAFLSPPPFVPMVPGSGPIGAAVFVLSLEPGTKITYSWHTTVHRSYSGEEHRESLFGAPRRRIEGTAFLLDSGVRDVQAAIMRAAARGATFLLALPWEEVTLTEDALGTVATVGSTAAIDWAQPGQRVVLIGPDQATLRAVVQRTSATAITLGVEDAAGHLVTVADLGAAGLAGARLMPLLPVLLDSQQGFARHPVAVSLWSIRCIAAAFTWAGNAAMGLGASISAYDTGEPVPLAELFDDDLLVWDRPNFISGTAAESMLELAEVVDLGALAFAQGGADQPVLTRSVQYRSHRREEWQWLKAFLFQIRGAQRAFLLPTNHDDLVLDALLPTGIKVSSGAGAVNYAAWFASRSHRRLQIQYVDGTVQYVTVVSIAESDDGSLRLALNAPVVSGVARISLLEQVRLAEDDVSVTWDGAMFAAEMSVRTAPETTQGHRRPFFDASIDLFFADPGGGGPQLVLVIPPGRVTMVSIATTAAFSVAGIRSPNGNTDGMVVCIASVNNSGISVTVAHESVSAPESERLRLFGITTGGVGRAYWFRYRGAEQRWVMFDDN